MTAQPQPLSNGTKQNYSSEIPLWMWKKNRFFISFYETLSKAKWENFSDTNSNGNCIDGKRMPQATAVVFVSVKSVALHKEIDMSVPVASVI